MKKIISTLIVGLFFVTFANAQSNVAKKEVAKEKVTAISPKVEKSSCEPDCTKTCCTGKTDAKTKSECKGKNEAECKGKKASECKGKTSNTKTLNKKTSCTTKGKECKGSKRPDACGAK